jgi:MoaA/NifB/PqqE/SkfB family radical SAM enzyme
VHERFHILTSSSCNNNCIFCMEADSSGARPTPVLASPERVRELLSSQPERGEVMFTYGEPTLNPKLPSYLRWARELGYRRIGVTTNARRLGYEPYARRLVREGMNHVVVSIHGPNAQCHDAQTRCPGSFAQTLAGLEVLAQIKRQRPLVIHTSTVVCRRNYKKLADLHDLLCHFGVDQCVLNVMQPLGRGENFARQLQTRYRDIVDELGRFLAAVGKPSPPVFLVDLPLCTTERLPDEVRGWVEFAVFTEYARDGQPQPRATRVDKEEPNRAKRDDCRRCRYDDICLGVWQNYVRAYGWQEFEPVPARGARTAARQPRSLHG